MKCSFCRRKFTCTRKYEKKCSERNRCTCLYCFLSFFMKKELDFYCYYPCKICYNLEREELEKKWVLAKILKRRKVED